MAGSGGYLRNVLAQTGARLVFVVTTLGVFIAIARVMGPERFGQYSYAVTFATIFATLADFGTGAVLARELADRRGKSDRQFWGAFLWLRTVSAMGLVLPALGVAHLLKPELALALAIACACIPVLAFRFFEPVYQVYDRPWDALPPALAASLLYAGATTAALASGAGVSALLVGYLVANAGYGIVAFGLSLRSIRPSFAGHRTLAKGIFVMSLPLGVSTVFTNLNTRIGTFVLGELRTDFDVGIYNAALRFLDLSAMVAVLMMTPLIPIFAQRAANDREGLATDYRALIEHLGVVVVPGAVLLPYLSPGIVHLAFGKEFDAAAPVLTLLGISAGLVFFSLASSAANVALGVVRHGYWVGALAVTVNLSLAAPLAFEYGAVGAAWGTLAAEVSMLAVSQYYTSTALRGTLRPLRWIAIAALSAALHAWLEFSPAPLAVSIATGIAAYAVVVWFGGLVEPTRWLRRRIGPADA